MATNTATAANAAPLNSTGHSNGPTKGHHFGSLRAPTSTNPKVRHATLDGQPVVYVELAGRHAQGREMLLDADAWERVREFNEWWMVRADNKGRLCVDSGRIKLSGLPKPPWEAAPRLALARLLTCAPRHRKARFKNGNSFDLRLENLEVVPQRARELAKNIITESNRASVGAKFMAKVDTSDADGCWPWTGAIKSDGYGELRVGSRVLGAHRVAYELFCGPIPKGKRVRHGPCGNKLCVNPQHLTIGTPTQNAADFYKSWWRKGVRERAIPLTLPERDDVTTWFPDAQGALAEVDSASKRG